MSNTYKYLALGDSYTIGEQVSTAENFPNQTVALLRKQHTLQVAEPQIIATTGWTTGELSAAIDQERPASDFDLVSLLIGVNNQYRGLELEVYKKEFAQLLTRAILFAQGRPQHVFVLSIPDWGLTPFAADKNRADIATAINAYNSINRAIALAYKCHYLDITASTRLHGSVTEYLTPDQLHYSGKEYSLWAAELAPLMAAALKG